ncbi:hypothetical protein TSOC_000267 [Tetrabaena socialis]|uniref:Reverse transcriptase zinc-binding domain-containing protein n=1 Tax=Tetrabaena socialis TaxID=47790 RepID=A0A2J8AJQ5_9CHLO|nr:hypothetical protein TSOC_000267 [Tetrabaena socialis]|eukprot:PNH12747.1 hypothetical protein TSOC_000267 [Tetrabaena socialis]
MAAPTDAAEAPAAPTLRRLWKLRWENEHKSALWRLAINGLPGFPMHATQLAGGGAAAASCPCGAAMVEGDRLHHFWSCAVAGAVRDALSAMLPLVVSREQLWLVRCPPGVHQRVWDVVCLAALSAMEYGRRLLYRRRPLAPGQQLNLDKVELLPVGAALAHLHAPADSMDGDRRSPGGNCSAVLHIIACLPVYYPPFSGPLELDWTSQIVKIRKPEYHSGPT